MKSPPKAAHRPSRRFPNAPRKVLRPEVRNCPYCGEKLKSTGNLYINREVQTMNGPLNVRAYGWRCVAEDCPCPDIRYRATRQLWRISLPRFGYGLDVVAHIGWQRDQKFRQFCEIQQELRERGIQICERHVGRLYRQYLALLGGLNEQKLQRLKKINEEHGGVVWALDALQPDQDGTQLYVLYEAISETAVAAAWLDKRDSKHLIGWLEPVTKLNLTVLGTLSDGEEAEIKALKTLWPDSPHQMCLTHFLGDCAKPIKEADKKLRNALRQGMGQLPSVPGDENSAQAGPAAATIPLAEPMSAAIATTSDIVTTDNLTTGNYEKNSSKPQITDVDSDNSSPLDRTTAPTKNSETQLPISNQNRLQEKLEPQTDCANQLAEALLPAEGSKAGFNFALHDENQTTLVADEKSNDIPTGCLFNEPENKSTSKAFGDSVSLPPVPSLEQKPASSFPLLHSDSDTDDFKESMTANEQARAEGLPNVLALPRGSKENKTTDNSSLPQLESHQQLLSGSVSSTVCVSAPEEGRSFITFASLSPTIDSASSSCQSQYRLPIEPHLSISSGFIPAQVSDFEKEINQNKCRMREIELLLRKSFQEALRHPSRYPSSFGGLEGYQQLSAIIQAMQEQLLELPENYLHRLLKAGLQALASAAELVTQLTEAVELHTQLIKIFFEPLEKLDEQPTANQKSSAEIKQEVTVLLNSFQAQNDLTNAFIAQTKRLIDQWEQSLFNCYDIPALPPNNAALESRFNRLRRGARRISGRKKTNELRRTAHFQLLLDAYTPQELLQHFEQVPEEAYTRARIGLEAAEERQRQLARLRRKPYQTASDLVAEYIILCKEEAS